MKLYKLLSLAVLAVVFSSSCGDDDKNLPSNEKQLTSFVVNTIEATIDQSAKTVSLQLPVGTSRTKLKPEVKVSDKATVSPASGAEIDFTNAVVYTVTAEDGSKQQYNVTITSGNPNSTYLYLLDKGFNEKKETVVSFTYDSNNRVTEFFSSYPNEDGSDPDYDKYTFTYDAQGKVSQYSLASDPNNTKVINYMVTYVDAKNIQVSYTEDNVSKVDKYELDANNRVVKYTEANSAPVTLTYDSKGNLMQKISEDSSKIVYAYGDKNGMYKDLNLAQWLSYTVFDGVGFGPNNLISIQEFEPDGKPFEDEQTCEYVYNEANYPISISSGYVNGPREVYTIQYKIVEKK